MDIETIWVDSYKDIPSAGLDHTLVAAADPKRRKIYAITGKSKDWDLLHEEYHVLKRHSIMPIDPVMYVRQELEADLYAHEKSGRPTGFAQIARSVLRDVKEMYSLTSREAKAVFADAVEHYKVPHTWEKGIRIILKERLD